VEAAPHAVGYQRVDQDDPRPRRSPRRATPCARDNVGTSARPTARQSRARPRMRSAPTRSAATCSDHSLPDSRCRAARKALRSAPISTQCVGRARSFVSVSGTGTAHSDERLDDFPELGRVRGRHQHPAALLARLRRHRSQACAAVAVCGHHIWRIAYNRRGCAPGSLHP